jgi:uroporphyrinogen-III synthase
VTETMAAAPLHGRRIVVTRAAHQAGELSGRLRQLGACPLEIPAITIQPVADQRPLDEAMAALGQYDWLIFTSANGVAVWGERVQRMGIQGSLPSQSRGVPLQSQGQELRGTQEANGDRGRVAAVGPVTAAALQERGIQPAVVPELFTGEALAGSLGALRGRRVLLAQAAAARPQTAESLAAQGAVVTTLALYESVPAMPDETALAELAAGVDAVTFASGSAVRFFSQAVAGRWPTLLSDTVIACIGPSTADVVRELGLRPAVVAEAHTAEGLAAALADYFQQWEHREK